MMAGESNLTVDMETEHGGMLSPYRVLDLTGNKGWMCGKLLGDLGADVIKIEPPGGDPGRNIGPFYRDEIDPNKSLYWFACNTSKRSVTLNLERQEGAAIFKKLLLGADFVLESFDPGYLSIFGLGYQDIEKINPRIIMVSITPFGQTGPYKDWKSADNVLWALGGVHLQWGDQDRAPIWIGHHPQVNSHAGAEGATAALMALYHRHTSGEGQQIDLSMHECATRGANLFLCSWDILKVNPKRGAASGQAIRTKRVWQCKDGYVVWMFMTGPQSRRTNGPLVDWIDSVGMASDFIKEFDWDSFDLRTVTQDTIDKIYEVTERFFIAHTKVELFDGAVKRRIMLYPIATTKDIVENVQLQSRQFMQPVMHPELNTTIHYPGSFVKTSLIPPTIQRRPPLIGEHNQEIYGEELGIPSTEIQQYKQKGVI